MNCLSRSLFLLLACTPGVSSQADADVAALSDVSALIRGLRNEKDRAASADRLAQLAKGAVPALCTELERALRNGDGVHAARVLQVIQRIGEDAGGAIPVLVRAVEELEVAKKPAAYQALLAIVPLGGNLDVAQMKTVRRVTNEADFRVLPPRQGPTLAPFCWALERYNLVDPDASVDSMIRQLRGRPRDVRTILCKILARRGPKAKKALRVLRTTLYAEMNFTRRMAKKKAKPFESMMPHDGFFAAGAEAMVRIAPRDPITTIAYGYRLNYATETSVRLQAAQALLAFGADAAEDAVPFLIEALERKGNRVKIEAMLALENLGPLAVDATPALERLAKVEAKGVARMARRTLAKIRGK